MNNIQDYEAYTINKQTDKNLKEKEENIFVSQRSQELILKGIFLVFLSLAGNFLDTMLPRHTRDIINRSFIVKQFITIIVIYFVLDFSSTKRINPIFHIKNTIIVYVLFNLFTKSVFFFSAVSVILLCINYIIGNYIEYNKFNNIDDTKLSNIEKYINILILLNIFLGFFHYVYIHYPSIKRILQ
jgi:hypothetical protein